ncbi:MAG TPA: nucleotide-binding protein [Pyrinomonadaceae bacterium]|nr:nucleotide-binding protein [Pyrinomonadaceae bacterium]
MPKPSVFVGSSSEGLEFARAVRSLLTDAAEMTIWQESVFEVGKTFIESLLDALPRFDYAILILTPDDLVSERNVKAFGPRDNVIFELGLFMGRLGRSRTFIVRQAGGKMKMPSDLDGVTTATYDWPRKDKSHKSAVGAACDSIRHVIRDLGVSDTKAATAITDIRTRQNAQEEQLVTQQAQIRSLQVAFSGIVTKYELDKLIGLSGEPPFFCYYSDALYGELNHLKAMNFIADQDGTDLSILRRQYKDRNENFDLKQFLYITEQGREYIRLRHELNIEPSPAIDTQSNDSFNSTPE